VREGWSAPSADAHAGTQAEPPQEGGERPRTTGGGSGERPALAATFPSLMRATITAMRPLYRTALAGLAMCLLVALALRAIGAEPYGFAWFAALLAGGLLVSLTDPVRFGWREPDERRRSR
jgi:hypothetical protein